MARWLRVLLAAGAALVGAGCGLFAAATPARCETDGDCPAGFSCVSGTCLARDPGDATAVDIAAAGDRTGHDASARDLATDERPAVDGAGAERPVVDTALRDVDVPDALRDTEVPDTLRDQVVPDAPRDMGWPDTPRDSGAPDVDGGCPLCPTCWGNAANFDFEDVALDFAVAVDLSECSPVINTSLAPTSMISGWCVRAPVPVIQTQRNGPSIVVVPMASLVIGTGRTLRLVGDKPVVFAVRGDALINGTIDASANGMAPGAGGDLSTDGIIATANETVGTGDCNLFAAGTGQGMNGPGFLSLGGGGAGFRNNGGFGGGERPNFRCYSNRPSYTQVADGYECKPLCPDLACDLSFSTVQSRYQANNGAHFAVSPIYGLAAPDQSLTPLRGGCAGGRGETRDAATAYYGGSGGGAVQITAAGRLTIGASGIVSAGGGGGTVIGSHGSGSGGGSGGAILLEATVVDVSAAAGIRAHGGSGGGREGSSGCSGTAESGHLADNVHATHSAPAGCVSEGRGGLSYWDSANPICNGTGASIGTALACTLPIADWPTSTTAYPEGGNFTDNNGGGGGGGSGGVIVVRRLQLAGACQ